MKLRQYLKKTSQTVGGFARVHGFSRSRVSAWVHDGAVPSLKNLSRIKKATAAEVTAADFVEGGA